MSASKSSYHSHHGTILGPPISAVSLAVRQRMYKIFEKNFVGANSVLDVGVTSESLAPEANFFEEFYPHKDRITAVGIEDAEHLEARYPGLKFIKIVPGGKLPFSDNQFDVVFSNAVIEHVVDEEARKYFFSELLRVGKAVFITTPNKFFPIEHHTRVPFIHFLWPKFFYFLLEKKILSKSYSQANLRPLSKQDLEQIAVRETSSHTIIPVKLLGVTANYVLIARKK